MKFGLRGAALGMRSDSTCALGKTSRNKLQKKVKYSHFSCLSLPSKMSYNSLHDFPWFGLTVTMGIEHLQEFIEKECSKACQPVDLLKISREYTQQQYQKRGALGPRARNLSQARLHLVVDAESCLDRLYGGYYSDWACGGQWNRMVHFLNNMLQACHAANMELVVFFNGALEADRIQQWYTQQIEVKKKVAQVEFPCLLFPLRVRWKLHFALAWGRFLTKTCCLLLCCSMPVGTSQSLSLNWPIFNAAFCKISNLQAWPQRARCFDFAMFWPLSADRCLDAARHRIRCGPVYLDPFYCVLFAASCSVASIRLSAAVIALCHCHVDGAPSPTNTLSQYTSWSPDIKITWPHAVLMAVWPLRWEASALVYRGTVCTVPLSCFVCCTRRDLCRRAF